MIHNNNLYINGKLIISHIKKYIYEDTFFAAIDQSGILYYSYPYDEEEILFIDCDVVDIKSKCSTSLIYLTKNSSLYIYNRSFFPDKLFIDCDIELVEESFPEILYIKCGHIYLYNMLTKKSRSINKSKIIDNYTFMYNNNLYSTEYGAQCNDFGVLQQNKIHLAETNVIHFANNICYDAFITIEKNNGHEVKTLKIYNRWKNTIKRIENVDYVETVNKDIIWVQNREYYYIYDFNNNIQQIDDNYPIPFIWTPDKHYFIFKSVHISIITFLIAIRRYRIPRPIRLIIIKQIIH